MKLFNWFKKKEEIQAPPPSTEKSWGDFTPEELISIAKMMDYHSYGSVDLNMNDVFAPAAWGVECMVFDLPALAELHKTYGPSGVIAWAAVKEGVDKTFKGHYPRFQEARSYIEANKLAYFWEERVALKRSKNEKA